MPRHALLLSLALAACDRGRSAYSPDQLCEGGEPMPQQLRLMTRREYNRTVADLFRLDEARTCEVDADCSLLSESCVGGVCEADPCNLVTFALAGGGRGYDSVVVAGTFNGWSPDARDGWPMLYVAEQDLWVTKRSLPDGEHVYKFVIDGVTWIPDPNNPRTTPDGYGGDNSVLTVACEGADDPVFDAAEDFPVESRPQGFPYDNSAEAGLVTAVHVEQYLRAGRTLAEQALRDPDALLGCDADDDACVEAFVDRFAARALRRPLRDEERAAYLHLVLAQDDRVEGLSVLLQVLLSSPWFLYRFEVGERLDRDHVVLTDFEMAHALSAFFWGGLPDDALWAAAEAGELSTPEQVEAQARRLLEDPRARDMVGVFVTQWLGIEGLPRVDRAPSLFPQWNEELAEDMVEEVRRFVARVTFDEAGSFDALLTSDQSFVNDRLAEIYGVTASGANTWQEVTLPEGRSGLLTSPAVLVATAHSDQTSPVRRGLFVRETLLCHHLGAPPPDAGGVPDVDPSASTRDRFAQHSDDPACSGCHQFIDPIGFGFESYDPLGAWRAMDGAHPIDASGEVVGVESLNPGEVEAFESLPGLAAILVGSEAAHTCFTTQAWRFSTGRQEDDAVDCVIEGLHDQFAQSDYSIQELLVAVVSDPSFRIRREAE